MVAEMTRAEIDSLWQRAMQEAVADGEMFTRYHFAQMVAAVERRKHQADIERWKEAAATAEKWRGLALTKDGDGRTVQRIQQEAAAAAVQSERDRVCRIVYGLCISDNNAREIVEALRDDAQR